MSDLEIARFQHADGILREKRPVDHGHEKKEDRSAVLNGVFSIGDVGVVLFIHDGIRQCALEHHVDLVRRRHASLTNLGYLLSFVSKLFVGETLADQRVEFFQILLRASTSFVRSDERPMARRSTALQNRTAEQRPTAWREEMKADGHCPG